MKTTTVSLTCHSKDYTQDFKDFSILIPENVPSNNNLKSFHKSLVKVFVANAYDCFTHDFKDFLNILKNKFQTFKLSTFQLSLWPLSECELSAEPGWAWAE